MTKNEIVARFMGWNRTTNQIEVPKEFDFDRDQKYGYWCFPEISGLYFDSRYDWLMMAWQKFRDLKFEKHKQELIHDDYRAIISDRIGFGTITEAFDELCKGIEWYQSLKK